MRNLGSSVSDQSSLWKHSGRLCCLSTFLFLQDRAKRIEIKYKSVYLIKARFLLREMKFQKFRVSGYMYKFTNKEYQEIEILF